MAYKARRTRDLQGEVKAGAGLGVQQTVKPDGTKVYTLENTAPGSEYFTTERTEGGWAILNQDKNILLASSTEFSDAEKDLLVFTKDGKPFIGITGLQSNNSAKVLLYDRASKPSNLIVRAELSAEGIVTMDDEGNWKICLQNDSIYLQNDDGNETLSVDRGYGNLYLRQESGNDGILLECGSGSGGEIRLYDVNGGERISIRAWDNEQENNAYFHLLNRDENEMLNSWQLVDMANAIIYWRMQTYNPLNNLLAMGALINEEIVSANNVRNSDYYETRYTNIDLGGDEYLAGIIVNYTGLYEIGILVSLTGTGGTITNVSFQYRIERENGNVDFLEDDEFSVYNGDSMVFTQTRIVELSAGDTICPLFETQAGDLINNNDDIRISMKKLR